MNRFRSQNISTRLEFIIVFNIIAAFLTGALVIAFTGILRYVWLFMPFAALWLLWLTWGTYEIRRRLMKSYEYCFTRDYIERTDLKTKETVRLGYSEIKEWRWMTDFYTPSRKSRIQLQPPAGPAWVIFQPPFSVKELNCFMELAEILKQEVLMRDPVKFR